MLWPAQVRQQWQRQQIRGRSIARDTVLGAVSQYECDEKSEPARRLKSQPCRCSPTERHHIAFTTQRPALQPNRGACAHQRPSLPRTRPPRAPPPGPPGYIKAGAASNLFACARCQRSARIVIPSSQHARFSLALLIRLECLVQYSPPNASV
jgi:hypothetical protein